MVIKLILSIVIIGLFILCVSIEWRIVLIMLMVLVWKVQISGFLASYWKWGYLTLWCVLGIALLLSLPRYFALPTDRVRHYYLNKQGEIKLPPVHHWLLNALLPEEELCNLGIIGAKVAGPLVGIAQPLMDNLHIEQDRGTLNKMLTPYKALSGGFENPMSSAYVQSLNEFVHENNKSFYLIRPKHYDKDKAYPLVVFCHGYLGNWKLYNGILMGLENCIVLSIGTHDLSGIFFDNDIREIKNLYIPLIEKMGYKIQADNITLMGLSNGGSAVNEAYRHFSPSFKNIVFISTPLYHSYPINSKVLVIGGGLDPSAPGMVSGYNKLLNNRGKVARFWIEKGTHFIFAINKDEIVDFLNTELDLR